MRPRQPSLARTSRRPSCLRCAAFWHSACSFTACRRVPDRRHRAHSVQIGQAESDALNWRAAFRSMHYIEQYAPSQDASRGIRL
jgi:hypothetical protein